MRSNHGTRLRVEALTEAVTLQPSLVEAWVALGHELRGSMPRAVNGSDMNSREAYERALNIDDSLAVAWNALPTFSA